MVSRKRQKGKVSGLKEDGIPNAYWRRFKERLDQYSDTPVSDWKDEQVLGHILKRYKDQMGIEFTLSYSGPPTKCKEIYCTRRTILALGTDQGPIIKKYIDWVFDTVIIPGKVTVSSIAYFFTTNFILKFKQELRRQSRISRATQLSPEIRTVVERLKLDVKTYGDLALAKVAIDDNPDNKDLDVYSNLFVQLKETGFDERVLSSLEG
jgi:hypothetical protein